MTCHEQKAKMACFSYETLPEFISSNGTLDDNPIGIPWKVYL
jgi:hypothetical protein